MTCSHPFAIRDLSVLAYAHGFTMWHYKLTGARRLEDVLSENYFSPAANMLTFGDQIHVSASDGAALLYVVLADAHDVRVVSMALVSLR